MSTLKRKGDLNVNVETFEINSTSSLAYKHITCTAIRDVRRSVGRFLSMRFFLLVSKARRFFATLVFA